MLIPGNGIRRNMSVDSKILSVPLEQGQKLSDLRPVFRLDLPLVGFSLSGESGKKQLSEGDAEAPRFICQQRNIFNRCQTPALHQIQMNRELYSFFR